MVIQVWTLPDQKNMPTGNDIIHSETRARCGWVWNGRDLTPMEIYNGN